MRCSLVVAALALSLAVPATADVIELKTGQRVEGTLKQATPASVSVEVGGQTITFEGGKVRAIYFGAAPAEQRQAPAPSSLPDRFVLWETTISAALPRPLIKNTMVLETRAECESMAARLREGMREVAQRANRSLFYQCLPVGVQPTPP